jgi:AAA domain-containing protein
MTILSGVTTGVQQVGQRIIIAGQEKAGKTTLICQAPKALLIPLEQGFGGYSGPRTPALTTWTEVEQLCEELIAEAKAGRIKRGSTIAWDSATALERFIHAHTVRQDKGWSPKNPNAITMEAALGGYGKAYSYANDLFGRWTRYMDELALYGGINIVVSCHTFAAKVIDPASGEYQTWDLLLHSPKDQKTYGKREFATQWADMIGFLHEPMYVVKAQEGERLNRGVSANQGRMLAVDRTPSWVAGNRYGMTGLIPIPPQQGWNAIAHGIWNATRGQIDVFNREGT